MEVNSWINKNFVSLHFVENFINFVKKGVVHMNKALANLILTGLLITLGFLVLNPGFMKNLPKFNLPSLPTDFTIQKDSSKDTPKESATLEKKTEQTPVKKEVFKVQPADGKGTLTPDVKAEMLTSSFWIQQLEEESIPVMSLSELSTLNSEIIKRVPVVYELDNYAEQLTKQELSRYITYYKVPDKTMYDYNGKALSQSFFTSISDNRNLAAIKETNKVRYGIVVKKGSIRSFPTESGAYSSSTDRNLDRFQETG